MRIEERTYTKDDHFRATGYILKTMLVTFKGALRATKNRPCTILYPWEKLIYPDNFRGRPGIILDKCIGWFRGQYTQLLGRLLKRKHREEKETKLDLDAFLDSL